MKQGKKDILWLMKVSGRNYHECEREYNRLMAEARKWLAEHEMMDTLRARYEYLLDCGDCIESTLWCCRKLGKPYVIEDGEHMMLLLSMGLLAVGKENLHDGQSDNSIGGQKDGLENESACEA
jgi:hypothetical protein